MNIKVLNMKEEYDGRKTIYYFFFYFSLYKI